MSTPQSMPTLYPKITTHIKEVSLDDRCIALGAAVRLTDTVDYQDAQV